MFHLNDDNTLFLFVDFQEKLMPAMHENTKTVCVAKKAYEFCKIMNLPYIFTTQYKKGLGGLVDEFNSENENVLDKSEFSCYKNSEIKKAIDREKFSNIVLFGQETHICVFQTARDLLEAEYNVFVVEDAITSRTEANKACGLRLLQSMGANIITLELVIFDILGSAKNPHFKEAQSLIK